MSQVDELLDKGMVHPSSSPFFSPILLVQKKDGLYRMCVDYHSLNEHMVKNLFLIPIIEDIFDKLQGSAYFSRIDLKCGYHQIRIVPKEIDKMNLCTNVGFYEFFAMPFDLRNAPTTSNQMMDKIFRSHFSFTRVFFDDNFDTIRAK